MKRHIYALIAICLALPTVVIGGEKVKIVRTTGFDRKVMYEIKNAEEYKTLVRQIQQEIRLHRKALDLAKKAWDEDAENKRGFPGSAVKSRTIKQMGKDYDDRNKAREKLYRLQDKEMEGQREEELAMKKLYRKMRKAEGLGNKEKCKAEIEEEEKAALHKKAHDLYCAKLFELIQAGQ